MGKKSQQKKQQNGPAATKENTIKKLPAQKRVELNQLIDSLLQFGFNPTNTPADQWNQYVQMKTLLSRVQVIESEIKAKGTGGSGAGSKGNRSTYIESFTKWVKEHGAEFDGIEIAEYPSYELGLSATKSFKMGETLLTIPKNIIMSLDNVSETIAPMMAQLPMIESMLNVKLAFSLLVERLNPNSFWKPYLDILPQKYSTVMNFTVAEMQELKGSNVLSNALNQCKNIIRQYAFINKFIQTIKEEQCDPMLSLLKDRFTYDLYW